jgi:hypothetical protein
MTTRNEIIAQIDNEISRLERARDFLAAALAGSNHDAKAASVALARRAKKRAPTQSRPRAAVTAAPPAIVAPPPPPSPPPPQPREEPQIRRVPPKRRMERRHLQTEKPGKSGAALSGLVPSGPVVVSADEARRLQERSVQPPPTPVVVEPRPEIGAERSLGSLIQAFERRAGLSGLETP